MRFSQNVIKSGSATFLRILTPNFMQKIRKKTFRKKTDKTVKPINLYLIWVICWAILTHF